MSEKLDIDPELSALRNELLTSLTKKNPKATSQLVNNEKECETAEEDNELELLRLEALNAKRIKTQLSFDKVKKNKIPGRFRYDKETDDEDEDDDIDLRNDRKSNDYDDDEDIKNGNSTNYRYNPYEMNNKDIDNKSLSETCNYHFNYQTYRAECSKLMANDAYDPNSTHEKQDLPEGFDLRNFLREKAIKQQHSVPSPDQLSTQIKLNDDDIVYEQPITEPIDIKSELFYHKFKGKFDYFNNNNRRKNYRINKDNHDMYDRHTSSNDKYQFYNNKFNNKKYRKEDRNCNKNENINEESNDDDSDDDSTSNCKKLRSVVAVISNSNK